MKGYSSLKQYVQDYRMYLCARRIDPGKEGETITSLIKKKIGTKLANSSPRFKKMLFLNKYTAEDLRIIAVHDSIGHINELRDFIRICFGEGYYSSKDFQKLLSTSAFKSGRLKRIYEFIPLSIDTEKEFLEFIRDNRHTTKSELKIIMKYICKKNWKSWMDDLYKQGKITFRRGCIQT